MLLVARENLLRIDPRQQGGAPNRTHNSTHALRGGGALSRKSARAAPILLERARVVWPPLRVLVYVNRRFFKGVVTKAQLAELADRAVSPKSVDCSIRRHSILLSESGRKPTLNPRLTNL